MIGSRVMGLWSNGIWYPGSVTQERERRGEAEYFVQFDDGDTAWLGLDKIQVKAARAAAQPGLAPFPGARVMGDWAEDSWYPGYVAEANPNETLFFVQFDDGDTKWLPPAKIRPHNDRPNAAPTPQLTPGTVVQGEWSEDSWYAGVVARANNNSTVFFIQFDDGDQKWLPASQLRFRQSAHAAIAPNPVHQTAPNPTHPVASPVVPPAAPIPPVAAPAPGRAVAPVAHSAPEVRCAYCNTRVTRSDLSRCSECGAKL